MLDTNCIAHELDNLYVVATCFFPGSGAVSPAFTAMTNALCVGDQALGVKADVSNSVDLQSLIPAAVKQIGRVDIMVNNAGIETRTSVLDTTEAQAGRLQASSRRRIRSPRIVHGAFGRVSRMSSCARLATAVEQTGFGHESGTEAKHDAGTGRRLGFEAFKQKQDCGRRHVSEFGEEVMGVPGLLG